MKVSQYARETGLHYRTVLNMFHRGDISGRQTSTGTIILDPPPSGTSTSSPSSGTLVRRAFCYSRVSNAENRHNLDSQARRLEDFCAASGLTVKRSVKEVGSGLNDTRPKLLALLDDRDSFDVLVVEHRDRLARFGVRYIEAHLRATRRELLVINEARDERADLMEDFVAVITSFCARLYGQRRSKRKTERIVAELQEGKDKP